MLLPPRARRGESWNQSPPMWCSSCYDAVVPHCCTFVSVLPECWSSGSSDNRRCCCCGCCGGCCCSCWFIHLVPRYPPDVHSHSCAVAKLQYASDHKMCRVWHWDDNCKCTYSWSISDFCFIWLIVSTKLCTISDSLFLESTRNRPCVKTYVKRLLMSELIWIPNQRTRAKSMGRSLRKNPKQQSASNHPNLGSIQNVMYFPLNTVLIARIHSMVVGFSVAIPSGGLWPATAATAVSSTDLESAHTFSANNRRDTL